MNTYVWCEDTGSGFLFWKNLFKSAYPSFQVESKGNNSRLRKSVEKITDKENFYYIIIDSPADNIDVIREVGRIQKAVNEKNNVKLILIHSFEFIILSFTMLEQWIFAKEDELKEKRQNLLKEKNFFVKIIHEGGTIKDIPEFQTLLSHYHKNNSEQIATELLYQITRNTGFQTDKSNLGDCFCVDCCQWRNKQVDDICGLDKNKINASEKIRQLISFSDLKNAFTKVGL